MSCRMAEIDLHCHVDRHSVEKKECVDTLDMTSFQRMPMNAVVCAQEKTHTHTHEYAVTKSQRCVSGILST